MYRERPAPALFITPPKARLSISPPQSPAVMDIYRTPSNMAEEEKIRREKKAFRDLVIYFFF